MAVSKTSDLIQIKIKMPNTIHLSIPRVNMIGIAKGEVGTALDLVLTIHQQLTTLSFYLSERVQTLTDGSVGSKRHVYGISHYQDYVRAMSEPHDQFCVISAISLLCLVRKF